jgi:signal transduction histidine kinase
MTGPDTEAATTGPAGPAGLGEARLAAVLRAVDHGILLLDQRRRVVEANPAFVELTGVGLPPALLRGVELPAGPATYRHVYAQPDAVAGRLTAIGDGGRPVTGERHALADGRPVDHDYTPITAGGATVGHLWLLRTPATARGTTAQDTARGATARDAAPRGAAAAAARRGEFAAALAHELRTPATSIAAFAELLDDPDIDAAGRHRAADAVRRNADRMLVLAGDLVLLSDLETGTGVPGDVPVHPGELVRAAVAASDVAIRTEIGSGPPVTGDRALLLRAVAAAIGIAAAVRQAVPPEPADDDAGVTVVAHHDGSAGWSVSATGRCTPPVTIEHLITARVAEHGDPDALRTAALCLLLARAIAGRHGGEVTTAQTACGYTVAIRLPAG